MPQHTVPRPPPSPSTASTAPWRGRGWKLAEAAQGTFVQRVVGPGHFGGVVERDARRPAAGNHRARLVQWSMLCGTHETDGSGRLARHHGCGARLRRPASCAVDCKPRPAERQVEPCVINTGFGGRPWMSDTAPDAAQGLAVAVGDRVLQVHSAGGRRAAAPPVISGRPAAECAGAGSVAVCSRPRPSQATPPRRDLPRAYRGAESWSRVCNCTFSCARS